MEKIEALELSDTVTSQFSIKKDNEHDPQMEVAERLFAGFLSENCWMS